MLFALLFFSVDLLLSDDRDGIGEVGANFPNGRVDASTNESLVVAMAIHKVITSRRTALGNFGAFLDDVSCSKRLFRILVAFILVVFGLCLLQVFIVV